MKCVLLTTAALAMCIATVRSGTRAAADCSATLGKDFRRAGGTLANHRYSG
jgi:hypothetical protein